MVMQDTLLEECGRDFIFWSRAGKYVNTVKNASFVDFVVYYWTRKTRNWTIWQIIESFALVVN